MTQLARKVLKDMFLGEIASDVAGLDWNEYVKVDRRFRELDAKYKGAADKFEKYFKNLKSKNWQKNKCLH